MSKGLKESGNYPRLRKERRPAAHVSCMDASRVLLARQFSDSELSEASNHYLQETPLLPEIDPVTRLDIERRFQKSTINASYVFPRAQEEPRPLLRTAERKSRQHKPSNSVTEEKGPGLVRRKYWLDRYYSPGQGGHSQTPQSRSRPVALNTATLRRKVADRTLRISPGQVVITEPSPPRTRLGYSTHRKTASRSPMPAKSKDTAITPRVTQSKSPYHIRILSLHRHPPHALS